MVTKMGLLGKREADDILLSWCGLGIFGFIWISPLLPANEVFKHAPRRAQDNGTGTPPLPPRSI